MKNNFKLIDYENYNENFNMFGDGFVHNYNGIL